MDPGILNSTSVPAPSLLQTSNCAPTLLGTFTNPRQAPVSGTSTVFKERVGQCPFHRPGAQSK